MILKAYNFNGKYIEVDKTSMLTFIQDYDIRLKDTVNVVSPIILVQSTVLPTFNYCEISDLFGFYYVVRLINIRNDLWEMQLHMDVLYTLKDYILDLKCLVSRNEFIFNNKLIDTIRPFTDRITIRRVLQTATLFGHNDCSFIATYIPHTLKDIFTGERQNINNGRVYPPIKELSPYNRSMEVAILDYQNGIDFLTFLSNNSQYASFVASCRLIPISISKLKEYCQYEEETEIRLPSGGAICNGYIISNINGQIYQEDYVDIASTDYKLCEPYSDYELYLPFFGTIQLPSNIFTENIDNYVSLRILTFYDLTTSNVTYYIYQNISDTTDNLIGTYSATFGAVCPLNYTNADDVERLNKSIDIRTEAQYSTATINAFANAGETVIGGVTKGLINPASGIASIGGGTISTIAGFTTAIINAQAENEAQKTLNVLRGSTTNFDSIYGSMCSPMNIICFIKQREPTFADQSDDWYNYKKIYGLPLNRVYTLSQLRGYTEITKVITAGISKYPTEVTDELFKLLVDGIILPNA